MASSLRGMLTRIIRKGTLEVIGADGQTQRFGDGSGSPIAIHFFDDQAEDEIYRDAQLKLGEIYMQGRMAFEKGDIYDLLALVKTNTLVSDLTFPMVWRGLLRVVAAKARGLCRSIATGAMSPTITISAPSCSTCFWTKTGNIPAPISIRRAFRWKRRNWRRNATSPQS